MIGFSKNFLKHFKVYSERRKDNCQPKAIKFEFSSGAYSGFGRGGQ